MHATRNAHIGGNTSTWLLRAPAGRARFLSAGRCARGTVANAQMGGGHPRTAETAARFCVDGETAGLRRRPKKGGGAGGNGRARRFWKLVTSTPTRNSRRVIHAGHGFEMHVQAEDCATRRQSCQTTETYILARNLAVAQMLTFSNSRCCIVRACAFGSAQLALNSAATRIAQGCRRYRCNEAFN